MQKQVLAPLRKGGVCARFWGVTGVSLFLFGCCCVTLQKTGDGKPQEQAPATQSQQSPPAPVAITLPKLSAEEKKKAAVIMRSMEMSAGFKEGKSGPHETLYVFVDPFCVVCHKLFHLMRPYVAQGVSIKWIPVAVLKDEEGVPFAATILQSGNKQEIASILGGQKRVRVKPTKKTEKSLNHNKRVFHELGGKGVPLIAYYSPRRRKACGYSGIPGGKGFEGMMNHKCPSE